MHNVSSNESKKLSSEVNATCKGIVCDSPIVQILFSILFFPHDTKKKRSRKKRRFAYVNFILLLFISDELISPDRSILSRIKVIIFFQESMFIWNLYFIERNIVLFSNGIRFHGFVFSPWLCLSENQSSTNFAP